MRGRFVSFLGAVGAIGFIACASFGGEEGSSSSSSGTPPGPNGQDGGPVVVATPGSLAVTFASPVRLVQGSSAKVHIKVAREGIAGTVIVTSKQLPEGIGLKPLELREGTSEGELELTATTTAKQGDVKAALVVARSVAGTEADSPMQLYVRGPAGTRDTTFGTDGIVDLGAASHVLSDASAQHLHIVVNNTLHRYARNGELDGTFSSRPEASPRLSV